MAGLAQCHRNSAGIPLRTFMLSLLTCLNSLRAGLFALLRKDAANSANHPTNASSPALASSNNTSSDALSMAARKNAFSSVIDAISTALLLHLPLILVNASDLSRDPSVSLYRFNIIDLFAWALYALVFGLVCVAEHQRYLHEITPKQDRPLPFLAAGLWAMSRNIGLFGECVLGWAAWLAASQALWSWSLFSILVAFIAPVFLFRKTLLVDIPAREGRNERRFGKLPAYEQYKAITSPFFPVSPFTYAYIHPRVKRAFFMESNNSALQPPNATVALMIQKMKPGQPIPYATHIARG